MKCRLKYTGRRLEGGSHSHRCDACVREWPSRQSDPKRLNAVWKNGSPAVGAAPLLHGPGSELATLFAEVSITEKVGCDCQAIAAEMNRAGPAGCRERRADFLT